MLQEATEVVMEKKPILRGGQNSGKALVPDSKLRQDVSAGGSGKFNRSGGRRWEGQASRSDPPSGKSSPFKKTPPQHRGFFSPARTRNQVAEADEAEVGSAARPGSKKLNMNHLLNFTYEGHHRDGRLSSHRNNRSVWTTRVHKYNKEQFLQANCQFVVEEGHDYSVHSGDPDLLVDWEWIEQVRVFSHELPSCPICLYPPVAAKMTRCGHLYCWPCMLHYLALSDKTWRKCPICYEAVYKNHLKSVVAQATPCYKVGDEITMVLMQRERGSVVAVPRQASKNRNGQPFQMKDSEQACFAKLVMATNDQVLEDIVNLEQMELETALELSKDCPEVCFIEDAIQQLNDRKEKLFKKSAAVVEDGEVQEKVISTVFIPQDLKIINYASAFDDEEEEEHKQVKVDDNCKPEENNIEVESTEKEIHSGSTGKDFYYFYQSADGQHIYMHALNAHMLIREYGSLEKCPDKVVAVVVEKESISMNEDLRRRLRYLAHLPLTCDFEVVEMQLTKPLVSDATLQAFSEEINKRRRKRNHRAREENKRERQLRAQENRNMGKVAGGRISLGSLKHFPEYGPINSSNEDQLTEASLPVSNSASFSSDMSNSPTGGGAGPSFAQMLREGKAKVEVKAAAASVTPVSPVHRIRGDSESDEEGMFVPTFRDSFCAALQDALDNYPSPESAQPEASGGRKKKGKQTKRLLFTTNVIRNK